LAIILCRQRLLLVGALVAVLAYPVVAEEILPRTLYSRAYRALVSGDFEDAYTDFSTYADKYAGSPARGAALLGAAKSAVYTERFDAVRRYANLYLEEFAHLSTRSLAFLYLGHAQVASGRVDLAVNTYGEGYVAARDRSVRAAFRSVSDGLADRLGATAAEEIFHIELPPEMAAGAWTRVGEKLDASGQRYRAARYYGAIADRYPDEPAGIAARVRQRELEAALAKTIRVGVLAPISGSLANYGKDMKRGVELAAGEYTDSTGRTIDLLVEDTEGSAVRATRSCQMLLGRDPVAVIGPLTSNAAVGCAAAAAAADVPLLLPAATETGLPLLGREVFCLSPSTQTYGITLGGYAVEGLELCSHLIIAPADEYGYDMAEAYREAVEAAGGEIWHETYYEPGITDFGPYLRTFKASFLDTLSDTTWFYAPDSTRLDQEEVTVYPDAIFTPGYTEDLVLLLPQIRFYKIAGRLIGTDSFADEDLMMRVGGNLEESIFGSVQPLADGIMAWEQFSARYSRKYGNAPTRMAALGYDAFRLLAGGLGDSLATPQALGRHLISIEEFDGAAGVVHFGPQGDNRRVPVYYIRDRQISPALR